MQWTPNARPQEQRRPYRDVLDALQERVRPFIERQPEFARPAYGSVLQSGADMLPGVGDVVGVEDLQAAARDGDPVGIGLGLLAAIPGIPAIGRGSRGARRGLMTGAREAAPSGGLMTDAESALARYRAVNPDDTGARVLNPGDEGYPTNAQWDEASQAYVAPVEPDYPIRAYHGSPHSFDQFSLDKIGTGEGAQAYGHGLYFAENEGVARQYRDALTTGGNQDYYEMDGRIIRKAWHSSEPEQIAAKTLYDNRNDKEASLAQIQRVIESGDTSRDWQGIADMIAQAGEVRRVDPPPGSMYEVGINAHPDTFLDWDKPLSEQPENVRAAFDSLVHPDVRKIRGRQIEDGSLTGPGVLRAPLGMDSYSDAAASAAWRDAGIPGIRYLDGNSRGAGEGSSNYVVFNDELVKILRKYGISGLGLTGGAALGGGLLGGPQDQQAQPTTF